MSARVAICTIIAKNYLPCARVLMSSIREHNPELLRLVILVDQVDKYFDPAKEDFDMVLMDLHMPILDGIEASRMIRNSTNPRIKNIPIIALTAAIMSESHDRIEDLNINDYVLKPFKPQDLYDRILKHIR